MLSTIMNVIVFLATAVLLARCFKKGGRWSLENGLPAFRYFTILSNVFSALAALAMAVCRIAGSVPPVVLTVKYLAAVSVAVTLMTVLIFLGPTQGYRLMLGGTNLFWHLIGPLLAIVSFCFLEKEDMPFSTALLGMIPVALYGVLYLRRVILAPPDRRWEDFYGFNAGGRWPVSFAAMMLGTLAVCALLWAL